MYSSLSLESRDHGKALGETMFESSSAYYSEEYKYRTFRNIHKIY